MEINLSSESIDIIIASLRNSRDDLKRQIRKHENNGDKVNKNKLAICKAQLDDVQYVLSIFEEAEGV